MALRLYTGLGSGNAYKPELLLRLLDVDYEPVPVSIPKGEHRSDAFLKLTPFGQIPVLVDGDDVYTDSHAILCYIARTYGDAAADRWFPVDAAGLARVMRWLSFSANEIQNGPTMARAAKLLRWPIDYDLAVQKSYRALRLLDAHLEGRDWLAASNPTVADIACYPYLLLADEGGIETEPFANVRAWMQRLETLPGFWPMPRIPNLPKTELAPYSAFLEGERA